MSNKAGRVQREREMASAYAAASSRAMDEDEGKTPSKLGSRSAGTPSNASPRDALAPTWVIQSNLLDQDQVLAVWNAAQQAGARVQEAVVIPFSDELGNKIPRIKGVVIPYGSTKLTRLAQERNWSGLCFDPDTFRVDEWNRHRNDMLNANARVMTVRQAMGAMASESADRLFFIRPVEDLKHFNGTLTTAAEIARWMSSVDSGNFSFSEHTEVIIAPPQRIHAEWRFFIVGGQVVDGSMYRKAGQLRKQHVEDDELYTKAQVLADAWLPHPTCVMDLAQTDDGLRVIEFNAFNSSGFYAHDIGKIVAAATRHLGGQHAPRLSVRCPRAQP